MKKLIFTIAVAASVIAEAKTTFTVKGAEVDAYQYVTNFIAKSNAKTLKFVEFDTKLLTEDIDAEVYARCESEFAKCNKIIYPFKQIQKAFPNAYTSSIMKCEACVAGISSVLLKKNDGFKLSNKDRAIFAVFNTYCSFCAYNCMTEQDLKELAKAAQPFAVAKIRQNKMAYVGDEGKANIEGYVNAVKDALNAYRLEGLTAAMRNIGMDCGTDFESMLLPESQIDELKEEILAGDKDMNKFSRDNLRTHLGVEKYNEFVKEYNGNN